MIPATPNADPEVWINTRDAREEVRLLAQCMVVPSLFLLVARLFSFDQLPELFVRIGQRAYWVLRTERQLGNVEPRRSEGGSTVCAGGRVILPISPPVYLEV